MSVDTCRAAETLWQRLPDVRFIHVFGEHIAGCARCRSLFDGPQLRDMAYRYLLSIGREPPPPPPTTAECEQVRYLAATTEPVEQEAFSRAYAEHIVACPRCLRLVPRAIAPEVLAVGLQPVAREARPAPGHGRLEERPGRRTDQGQSV